MPKKSTEFVVLTHKRGARSEVAGPYWQKRDALRAMTKLLEGYGWQPAVRAVVYERPAPNDYNGDRSRRDDRKQWRKIATAEKKSGSRFVQLTETREVA